MILLLAFVAGAVVGSFLNVCIWRLPAAASIVSPPSHCPHCQAPIRPRDNIPLVSYVLLRGRCRACRQGISLRYPAVEAMTGVLFTLVVWHFGLTPIAAVDAIFVAALVAITFIDLDHQIIPDVISLPGIGLGVLCALLGYGPSVWASLAGAVLGGGLLAGVAVGYYALTGREGMGGGDVKLLAMIGAFLGWKAVLVTVVLGSLTGAIVGLVFIRVSGADARAPIPFGPFLAGGAVCALFVGDPLIHWYLSLAVPS